MTELNHGGQGTGLYGELPGSRRGKPKGKKRRAAKRVLIVVIVACLLLGVAGGSAVLLLSPFGDRIKEMFGVNNNDYEGEGSGSVIVTIRSGETGTDVANTLAKAGVVKTSDAFVKLLLEKHPDATFEVGSYKLRKHMSAAAAFKLLQNPDSKMELTVVVPEGMAAVDVFARAADVLGLQEKDFVELNKNPQQFGVPEGFPSLEGFLFPATYTFEPDDTAKTVIQKMVDRMWQALQQHGVAAGDELRVLTLASIVQREAGSNLDDFPKIARVFQNRLDQGKRLQSDATVAYGTGNTHTVWTTPEERADASNKYNTYANDGLPIGPIGNPGDVAIAAAVHPAEGDWLFFMPINLETGETKFSVTGEEHEEAVQELAQWCKAHRAAGGKRCD